jgi:CRP-like cAMP-binding protein
MAKTTKKPSRGANRGKRRKFSQRGKRVEPNRDPDPYSRGHARRQQSVSNVHIPDLANRLLGALPERELKQLQPHLEEVDLRFEQVLYEPEEEIEYVYFLNGGVISLLTKMESGERVEIATVGNEGMVGTPIVLGALSMHDQAICQVPGTALRMPARTLLRMMDKIPNLRGMMNKYMQGLVIQFTQGVACNRLHTVEERCARWLLMTHDRVGTDNFPLTQEFLALMLGVRRPSVSVVAGQLQRAGLIKYTRGSITVMDREGLEDAACECYGVIVHQFEKLFGKGSAG